MYAQNMKSQKMLNFYVCDFHMCVAERIRWDNRSFIITQCLSVQGGALHMSTPNSAVGCCSVPACLTRRNVAISNPPPTGGEFRAPTGDPLPGRPAWEFLRTHQNCRRSSSDLSTVTHPRGCISYVSVS